MTNKGHTLTILVASLGLLGACGGVDDGTPIDPGPDTGGTAGNEDTTFDHDNSGFNPFDLIDRLAKEGPPRFTARVHSCPKVRYRTLGNVLQSFGVNATTNATADQLYVDGFNALGGPNYANRIRENLNITTASASREFDIFAGAAQTVIDGMPNLVRCQISGQPTNMFDANNNCTAQGIQCLIGAPATAAHLDFCNITVTGASDLATGKRIAVAAILAAAYTCE
jgi:hypothetical protein